MNTKLGKIKNAYIGRGGYQGAELGLWLELGGESWDACDGQGTWDPEQIRHDEHSKWTEDDRNQQLAAVLRELSKYLRQAKVDKVQDLIGKPVEVTFKNVNHLDSWRILEEVL